MTTRFPPETSSTILDSHPIKKDAIVLSSHGKIFIVILVFCVAPVFIAFCLFKPKRPQPQNLKPDLKKNLIVNEVLLVAEEPKSRLQSESTQRTESSSSQGSTSIQVAKKREKDSIEETSGSIGNPMIPESMNPPPLVDGRENPFGSRGPFLTKIRRLQ
jgi:hypothetical protein